MPYILIILFTIWFIDFLHVPKLASEWLAEKRIFYKTYYGQPIPRRLKPFDCTLCLSFWISFIHTLTSQNFFTSFLYGAACSLGACVLTLIINKLR